MFQQHPKNIEEFIGYGTAGFRTKANLLDHVLFRMGIFAAIRSRHQKATIGAMITASHNPEDDNGVKLVDPMGEMLSQEWEKYATDLANVSNDKLKESVENLIKVCNLSKESISSVVLGRDTRSSSLQLSESFMNGLAVLNSTILDIGIVTTPQLHYMVRCMNDNSYGIPSIDGYYSKLSKAFNYLNNKKKELRNYDPSVIIDGANGVGAFKVKNMSLLIMQNLNISVHNDGSSGKLNYQCGADYVKLNQKVAEGMPIQIDKRYASFDGDADRIIYFYIDKDKKFYLLDGDKIATLIACYLNELVLDCELDVKMGVVQTAYANGASTSYLTQKMKIAVTCVPTGVKYLHHAAQSFDIGIYFEANGHGTIIFSDNIKKLVGEILKDDSQKENKLIAAKKIFNFINLTNETVGDAISDLLLVETILRAKDWSIQQWNTMYDDLPNRQTKILVEDRNDIVTVDAERIVSKPIELQPAINALVTKYKNGRSFVRPSGTENVVRVYAEADSQSNTDLLAYEVGLLVYEKVKGCGPKPEAPKLYI